MEYKQGQRRCRRAQRAQTRPGRAGHVANLRTPGVRMHGRLHCGPREGSGDFALTQGRTPRPVEPWRHASRPGMATRRRRGHLPRMQSGHLAKSCVKTLRPCPKPPILDLCAPARRARVARHPLRCRCRTCLRRAEPTQTDNSAPSCRVPPILHLLPDFLHNSAQHPGRQTPSPSAASGAGGSFLAAMPWGSPEVLRAELYLQTTKVGHTHAPGPARRPTPANSSLRRGPDPPGDPIAVIAICLGCLT
jgi:hypothetical protein